MLVYTAGPYGADTTEQRDTNILTAREVSQELWEMGHTAICPHMNTALMEETSKFDNSDFYMGDLEILLRCDAIVMLPDWEESSGAIGENSFALGEGIPIYEYPDLPPLNAVQRDRPNQSREFMATLMRMYRTHLSKNADYSPANILATGEVGLVTRLWDKVARLMNLTGFHVEIDDAYFEKPQKPKHESIDDNLLDLAVYAVIGTLLRKGVWGK